MSVQTLIELYDERAIENVLAADVFRPERIIYLCPEEIAADQARQKKYAAFFRKRGWKPQLTFVACSLYDSEEILRQLEAIHAEHTDCALDVTGGTDAALFAGGMLAMKHEIPVFTYSRKMNSFYNIRSAPFADRLPCALNYRVEDFFLMAGGRMRPGRVDNRSLRRYLPIMDGFFEIYLTYRRRWNDAVCWFQRVSQDEDQPEIIAALQLRGDHGKRLTMPPALLTALAELGMLTDLQFSEDGQAAFRFADDRCRAWLRDVGSVLELYVYKACLDTEIFNDVVSSAVVDWDDTQGHASVSNEIDAVAACGVIPLFISCKTCAVHTEALNELAIMRDRFGGKGAKAAIVTGEKCNAAARHRAAQLGIAVIDLEELIRGELRHRLKVIMKVEK